MTITLDAQYTDPRREPRSLFEVSEPIRRALERGGADLSKLGVPAPPQDELEPLVWNNIAVPKDRAREAAWVNSMRAASHDDYLKWRFAHLAENQKPKVLSGWLDSLIEAKKTGARPDTMHMIVPGNVGSGKTTALAALGNEASSRGLFVRFVKHATYLAWRRPDGAPSGLTSDQVLGRHVYADLLILDELCGSMAGVGTEFVQRETEALIDARLAAGRPTAFSSNRKRNRDNESGALGIAEILGDPLVSRLEDRAHVLKIVGPDRRAPAKRLDW